MTANLPPAAGARLEVRGGGDGAPRVATLRPGTDLPGAPSPFALWLDQELAPAIPGSRTLATIDGAPAIVEDGDGVAFLFDPARAVEALLHERHVRPRRPLHTLAPLPYQLVPGEWRLRAFRWLAGAGAAPPPGFPGWPLDDAVDALIATWVAAARRAGAALSWPPAWPEGHGWAFVVSHDVDTLDGLRRAPAVAEWEAARGIRSAWFVVGEVMRRDPGAVAAIRAAGHELGLHGDRHDNRLGYAAPATIARRLDACADLVADLGLAGFRAPSLLESPALREELRQRFAYASQVPDTEVNSLLAPRRGCTTLRPFWREGLLEVPITLPLDDKLLLTGGGEREIIAAWRGKLDAVRRRGGIGQLVVHNEAHLLARCRTAFERVVAEGRADAGAWHATPGEVARFWDIARRDG